MRVQLQDNTKQDNTNRGVATLATVNQFLLTLITKRLYEDLAERELLWRVTGYLGKLTRLQQFKASSFEVYLFVTGHTAARCSWRSSNPPRGSVDITNAQSARK